MSQIEKTAASLTIFGKALQPDEITMWLGCLPTQAAKTDDRLMLQNGKTRRVRIGFWKLEYEAMDAVALDQKIERMLGCLTNNLDIWDRIAHQNKIELFCGLFVGAWNEGFALPSRLVEKLGQRHIELSFDVYAPVDSWYASSENELLDDAK